MDSDERAQALQEGIAQGIVAQVEVLQVAAGSDQVRGSMRPPLVQAVRGQVEAHDALGPAVRQQLADASLRQLVVRQVDEPDALEAVLRAPAVRGQQSIDVVVVQAPIFEAQVFAALADQRLFHLALVMGSRGISAGQQRLLGGICRGRPGQTADRRDADEPLPIQFVQLARRLPRPRSDAAANTSACPCSPTRRGAQAGATVAVCAGIGGRFRVVLRLACFGAFDVLVPR
mmetsp:Transcript_159116/g.510312  ORF Transcript_159116/g.510312 Transcript_159116/m.510312 type:complete len:231 (-) Transcript_159116:1070-1762(-)